MIQLDDAAGKVTEILDPDRNTTTFTDEDVNRVTSQTSLLASASGSQAASTFAYDHLGLLTSTTLTALVLPAIYPWFAEKPREVEV